MNHACDQSYCTPCNQNRSAFPLSCGAGGHHSPSPTTSPPTAPGAPEPGASHRPESVLDSQVTSGEAFFFPFLGSLGPVIVTDLAACSISTTIVKDPIVSDHVRCLVQPSTELLFQPLCFPQPTLSPCVPRCYHQQRRVCLLPHPTEPTPHLLVVLTRTIRQQRRDLQIDGSGRGWFVGWSQNLCI